MRHFRVILALALLVMTVGSIVWAETSSSSLHELSWLRIQCFPDSLRQFGWSEWLLKERNPQA